jgi:hypothetical protein
MGTWTAVYDGKGKQLRERDKEREQVER